MVFIVAQRRNRQQSISHGLLLPIHRIQFRIELLHGPNKQNQVFRMIEATPCCFWPATPYQWYNYQNYYNITNKRRIVIKILNQVASDWVPRADVWTSHTNFLSRVFLRVSQGPVISFIFSKFSEFGNLQFGSYDLIGPYNHCRKARLENLIWPVHKTALDTKSAVIGWRRLLAVQLFAGLFLWVAHQQIHLLISVFSFLVWGIFSPKTLFRCTRDAQQFASHNDISSLEKWWHLQYQHLHWKLLCQQ